ncbi:hypothetical protein K501DRAFT_172649, partial [Backusella circina FSU 941]
NKRPDYTVDIYKSYDYAFTSVFGEGKVEASQEVDLIRDFYRLCLFSKPSVQQYSLDTCLFFQAVGKKLHILYTDVFPI